MQRGLLQPPRLPPEFLAKPGRAGAHRAFARADFLSTRSYPWSKRHADRLFRQRHGAGVSRATRPPCWPIEAAQRGHRVCYVTPVRFRASARRSAARPRPLPPKRKYKDRAEFFDGARRRSATRPSQIDIAEIDVLMLRSDPSLDAQATPWAAESASCSAARRPSAGVLVLNDPDSLSRAINKLYFQSFPAEVRAETLITRHRERHQGVRQGAWRQHHPEAAAGIGRVGRVQGRLEEASRTSTR